MSSGYTVAPVPQVIDLGHGPPETGFLPGVAIDWIWTDGGRAAAGFTGRTGDCGARAAALAAERPYREVYDRINELGKAHERTGKRKRKISNARTGVYPVTMKRLMAGYGAIWTPTMTIGSGCTVHLAADELPSGRLVVSLSRHYAAVIDRVLFDNHDCSRDGTRCVYGYWQFPE